MWLQQKIHSVYFLNLFTKRFLSLSFSSVSHKHQYFMRNSSSTKTTLACNQCQAIKQGTVLWGYQDMSLNPPPKRKESRIHTFPVGSVGVASRDQETVSVVSQSVRFTCISCVPSCQPQTWRVASRDQETVSVVSQSVRFTCISCVPRCQPQT